MTGDRRERPTGRDGEGTRALIALGGNALLRAGDRGTYDDQLAAVERTAAQVADAIEDGYEVVLTHGNGPQVGYRLLEQAAGGDVPRLPLDVLVAETQAQIGYLLQQALDNALGGGTDFVTVVTQTVVDPDDPAFDEPTKPVGPWYSAAEAAEAPFETREVGDGDRPFRRVVPSPAPLEVVEADEIARLVEAGNRVVCAGGGGVPVVREEGLRGVEAVVDKDRTSALLARSVGADLFVSLTNVPHAYVDFGGPDERPLRDVEPGTLREHLEAGEFGRGSMRPKVQACLEFVESGGERGAVAELDRLGDALAGVAGTQVRPA